MPVSLLVAALVAALVGFAGTLALVVAAAQALGATTAQTASWVTAICLAKALTSSWLSLRHRIPIITAWSTPGAALIAASGGGIALPAATGAFMLAAALIVLTAALAPLGRAIARIPTAIAAAMLAGVLFGFVAQLFTAAAASPAFVLPLLAAFIIVRLLSPMGAVLAVLALGVLLTLALGRLGPVPDGLGLATLALVPPRFEPAVLLGLGLPLYIVTMASQNLPGFAVLKAAGYAVPSRSILGVTGLASLVSALFGAHTSNLAAITAAICTGPEAHPDPARRWLAGPAYGFCYLVFALFGAQTVGLFAALPPELVAAVAGLALVAPLAGALTAALADEPRRFAAVLTFAATASGAAYGGIGAAFWGLLLGLGVQASSRLMLRRRR